MSDAEVRALERRWKTSAAPADRLAYEAALARRLGDGLHGELEAFLTVAADDPWVELAVELERRFGRAVAVRLGLFAARRCLPAAASVVIPGSLELGVLTTAVDAIGRWVERPCGEREHDALEWFKDSDLDIHLFEHDAVKAIAHVCYAADVEFSDSVRRALPAGLGAACRVFGAELRAPLLEELQAWVRERRPLFPAPPETCGYCPGPRTPLDTSTNRCPRCGEPWMKPFLWPRGLEGVQVVARPPAAPPARPSLLRRVSGWLGLGG